MSLDLNDEDAHIGVKGTSTGAIRDICKWINDNSVQMNLHLTCVNYKNSQVSIENLEDIINSDGVIYIRIKDLWNTEHYVMISSIDKNYVYVFDPYYFKKSENKNTHVHVFNENQFGYNITIDKDYFVSNNDTYTIYSANEIEATAIFKN